MVGESKAPVRSRTAKDLPFASSCTQGDPGSLSQDHSNKEQLIISWQTHQQTPVCYVRWEPKLAWLFGQNQSSLSPKQWQYTQTFSAASRNAESWIPVISFIWFKSTWQSYVQEIKKAHVKRWPGWTSSCFCKACWGLSGALFLSFLSADRLTHKPSHTCLMQIPTSAQTLHSGLFPAKFTD